MNVLDNYCHHLANTSGIPTILQTIHEKAMLYIAINMLLYIGYAKDTIDITNSFTVNISWDYDKNEPKINSASDMTDNMFIFKNYDIAKIFLTYDENAELIKKYYMN